MSGAPPRARTAIEVVWPHTPHRRCPRSWRRHRSQIRCPAESRLASGLTPPQCAHAPVSWRAAHDLHVHVGWTVAVYDLGEALANLVQPFWMLPTLAILGLRARDVMGYTFIVFLVLAPVVLGMVTVLGATLTYPL